MFRKFWNVGAATCSTSLMSGMLSCSACDTEASLSAVMPRDSRLSLTKPVSSPARSPRSRTALPTSLGSLATRLVTDARFWLSWASRPLEPCSADTSRDRFFSVVNRSSLWSPSAEIAWESLMMVSRMVAPCPRRLSAVVLTNAPSGLTPPGWVGCRASLSFCSCWRKSSNSTGTAVRSRPITVLSAITGPRCRPGSAGWRAR